MLLHTERDANQSAEGAISGAISIALAAMAVAPLFVDGDRSAP